MTYILNTDPLNGTVRPDCNYLWTDSRGIPVDLNDIVNFCVLRDSIDGVSGYTDEYQRQPTPNYMAEMLGRKTSSARTFGFSVLVFGTCHEDLELKRRFLLDVLSPAYGAGTLSRILDDGTRVSITAFVADGSPRISGGLPPGAWARTQEMSVQFVAADPYFYGDTMRVTGSGVITVTNRGNVPCPCTIKIKGTSCGNTTSGKTMTANAGTTLENVVVNISDTAVSAVLAGATVLSRFTCGSQFFMLEPGQNIISGAYSVEFRPRWSGI